jgi:O-antigen/teichoic acid export membrane protein
MFVSVVTVPIYLHLIGTAEYGVLAIVWMFLGYFGVFDPGISRATAYNISRMKNESLLERQSIFWTAVTINSILGLLGGVALYFLGHQIFGHFFKMPQELRSSVLISLPWLAAAVPVGTLAGIFSGTLEGLSKFGLLNSLNVAGTLVFQILPLIAAYFFRGDLSLIIATTVLIRLMTALLFFVFAWHHCSAGRPRFTSYRTAKQLLSYGSWISVSNLISPFLGTLDKIFIGSYLGVSEVAIYSICDNLTRRVSVIPGALSRSLFPKISSSNLSDQERVFEKYFFILLAVLTPVCVLGIMGMHAFLQLWVGSEIARKGGLVGVILLVGIFLNSLAFLPSMYLQATGKPNKNAKFHLIEIVPHILFLLGGIFYLKLIGVALAMLIVSGLDAILLFWAAGLYVWKLRPFQISTGLMLIAVAFESSFGTNSWPRYILFAFMFLFSSLFCLQQLMVSSERIDRFCRNVMGRWRFA